MTFRPRNAVKTVASVRPLVVDVSGYTPTPEQKAVGEQFAAGEKAILVNATAGSGKSTLLLKGIVPLVPAGKTAVYLAFNNSIVDEMTPKMPQSLDLLTVHKVANKAIHAYCKANEIRIHKDSIQGRKYNDLANSYFDTLNKPQSLKYEFVESVCNLIKYVMVTLSEFGDTDAYDKLCDYYSIDIDSEMQDCVYKAAMPLFLKGLEMFNKEGVYSFDEMLFLPYHYSMKFQQWDIVLADEVQDFSKLQSFIVMSSLKENGQIVLVGDINQSIYSFTGADSQSIPNLITLFNAKLMRLTVCFRCPVSHIEMAHKYVHISDIQPSANAIKGKVNFVNYETISDKVKAKDLILSRVNAPLVRLCFELIKSGVPANIKGKDIAKNISALLYRIARVSGFDKTRMSNFIDCGQEFIKTEQATLTKKFDENKAAYYMSLLMDKMDCLLFLYNEQVNPISIQDFVKVIERLFGDKENVVVLSSIHRAKGLEADNVFVLRYDLLPHPLAKQAHEIRQEMNLGFVAVTRAKKTLNFISKPLD